MSINAHLQELERKHHSLSAQVEEAQRSPSIDDLHLSKMKKEKLKLKQEIQRFSGGGAAATGSV